MTRIISEESNKKLQREYRLRFLTIFFFALAITLLINLSLVASSYVLLSLYEKAYTSSNSNILNEQALLMRQDLDAKISQTYALAKKVPQDTQSVSMEVAPVLLDYSGNAIKLNSIEMLQEESLSKITIRGESITRDALLEFQSKIKQDARFADFNIPIETLTKQKDISFAVTFTYNEN